MIIQIVIRKYLKRSFLRNQKPSSNYLSRLSCQQLFSDLMTLFRKGSRVHRSFCLRWYCTC